MRSILIPALAASLAFGSMALAQNAAQLTIATVPAKGGAKLSVTSPAFKASELIPLANSAYATPPNTFPGLSWTAGPAGTQSYAVIFEDPDLGPGRAPFLHWYVLDIPAGTTSLAPGAPGTAPMPAGTVEGGFRGAYFGPRTPAGTPHNYHFQVFALDKKLGLPARTPLPQVVEAMKGHVLASGELVGKFDGTPYAAAAGPARGAPAPAPK